MDQLTNIDTSYVGFNEGTQYEGDRPHFRALTLVATCHSLLLPPRLEYSTTYGEREVEVLMDMLQGYGIRVTSHTAEIEEIPNDEPAGRPGYSITTDTLELDLLGVSKFDVYEVWRKFLNELETREPKKQTITGPMSNGLLTAVKNTQKYLDKRKATSSGQSSGEA